jgi:hypothetical protein
MRSEFLELPHAIGEAIARSVKAFADALRPPLQCHLWYHDQPLWLVWERDSKGVIRRVQVGAYRMPDGQEELRFVPRVFFEDTEKKLLKAMEISPSVVISCKVSEFKGEASKAEYIVKDKLGDAWKAVQNLPNEFTWTTPLHLA